MSGYTDLELPRMIRATRFGGRQCVAMHQHDGTELVLVKAGRCEVDTADTTLKGSAGSLFVLPGHVDHNQRNFGVVQTCCVVFQAGAQLIDESARVVAADDFITRWMEDLRSLVIAMHGGTAPLASGLLYSVLQRIAQLDGVAFKRRRLSPALTRALFFIESSLHRPLTLDAISRYAGVSQGHLVALFRGQGMPSPIAYSMKMKLKLAERLLLNPLEDPSIKEVSATCGFNDVNYFCRIFRKHFGDSPGQYRLASRRA